MKILLSAYECAPGRGSESGAGWQWATELVARGHEVWVITCDANRACIERHSRDHPSPSNLRFVFVELGSFAQYIGRVCRTFYPRYSLQHNYFHYALWQRRAYRVASSIAAAVNFDVVHHITIGNFRASSYMGRLGIPFLLGPLAGGETAPRALRRGYGLRGRVLESIRELGNRFVWLSPGMRSAFRAAFRIFVSTEESLRLVPKQFQHKTEVRRTIGIEPDLPLGRGRRLPPDDSVRLLFAGRLVYWKGMHLGIAAVAEVIKRGLPIELTLLGHGPDAERWRGLAKVLQVENHVHWMGWLPQEQVKQVYSRHHILLFPSLHDSGGFVVLEALTKGLPVICLDLGGPATLVDSTCGRVISVAQLTADEVVTSLADAIDELSSNPDLYAALSLGAVRRALQFTWGTTVDGVYAALPAGGATTHGE